MAQKKTIVLDASSAILLVRGGLLECLVEKYRTLVPWEIYQEITRFAKTGAQEVEKLRENQKIIISDNLHIDSNQETATFLRLDRGEKQVILRYLDGGEADFIVIDDGPAARWCMDHDLPFVNALLIPKVLAFAGCIDPIWAKAAFLNLQKIGRYSTSVCKIAFRLSGSELKQFCP